MTHLISHQPKYALFVIKQTLKQLIVFLFLFLNNSVLICYGEFESRDGQNIDVTLSISYTVYYAVIGQQIGRNGLDYYKNGWTVIKTDLSSFNSRNNSNGTNTWNWISIGY